MTMSCRSIFKPVIVDNEYPGCAFVFLEDQCWLSGGFYSRFKKKYIPVLGLVREMTSFFGICQPLTKIDSSVTCWTPAVSFLLEIFEKSFV